MIQADDKRFPAGAVKAVEYRFYPDFTIKFSGKELSVVTSRPPVTYAVNEAGQCCVPPGKPGVGGETPCGVPGCDGTCEPVKSAQPRPTGCHSPCQTPGPDPLPTTFHCGLSAAEICRRNGWKVGDVIEGTDVNGYGATDRLRIDKIGADFAGDCMFTRLLGDKSYQTGWSLQHRDWKLVERDGKPVCRDCPGGKPTVGGQADAKAEPGIHPHYLEALCDTLFEVRDRYAQAEIDRLKGCVADRIKEIADVTRKRDEARAEGDRLRREEGVLRESLAREEERAEKFFLDMRKAEADVAALRRNVSDLSDLYQRSSDAVSTCKAEADVPREQLAAEVKRGDSWCKSTGEIASRYNDLKAEHLDLKDTAAHRLKAIEEKDKEIDRLTQRNASQAETIKDCWGHNKAVEGKLIAEIDARTAAANAAADLAKILADTNAECSRLARKVDELFEDKRAAEETGKRLRAERDCLARGVLRNCRCFTELVTVFVEGNILRGPGEQEMWRNVIKGFSYIYGREPALPVE